MKFQTTENGSNMNATTFDASRVARTALLLLAFFCLGQMSPAQCQEKAEDFQKKLNKQFSGKKHSPLTEEDRSQFSGLEFYPINPDFCLEAKWVPTPQEESFKMPTSNQNRQKTFVKQGELQFVLKGVEMKINVYKNLELQQKKYKDHLFIPFTDLTTGNDSYGGGRYIDWEIPKEGIPVILDFNQCYNPYCAYSTGWSCPIPPEENFLDIRIEAGVKAWGH